MTGGEGKASAISLRAMTTGDLAVVDPLLMAAYGNPKTFEPRLKRLLRIEPEGYLVACEEGRPVGTGGLTVMGKVAYVGLVAVDKEHQRKGIASALMRRVLDMAQERGCATVLLDASPEGRPLYEKLGFIAEDMAGVWKRPEGMAAGAAAMVNDYHNWSLSSLALEMGRTGADGPGPVDEVVAFDRGCWGADRSRTLASFAADDPVHFFLARDPAGRLGGYCVHQSADGLVGPFVCADHGAARILLGKILEKKGEAALMAYLPAANQDAIRLFSGQGFTLARSNTHMRLGPALAGSRRRLIYSQASFALG